MDEQNYDIECPRRLSCASGPNANSTPSLPLSLFEMFRNARLQIAQSLAGSMHVWVRVSERRVLFSLSYALSAVADGSYGTERGHRASVVLYHSTDREPKRGIGTQ